MSRNVDNLVTMANQIGDFFGTMANREQSLDEIVGHLRRFWEPRMRHALMAHVDEANGIGLHPIVLDSLRTRREKMF